MGALLDKLLELQKIHVRLRALQAKARAADVAVIAKERQLARQKADLDKLLDTQKSSRKANDSKELEIRSLQSKIDKFKEQLNTVKTNKEYQTLQNEIKFTQTEVRRIEGQLLAEMEKSEQSNKKIDEARAAIALTDKEVADLKAAKAAENESLQEDIRKAERERADVARELPADALDAFERIAVKNDDGAMSPLVKDDEDSIDDGWSCGGCFMRLTENVYVKLLGRADEIITCPNCSHILYLEP